MNQVTMFLWLKAKEAGIALLIILSSGYLAISAVLIIEIAEKGFLNEIWPLYLIFTPGLLVVIFVILYFFCFIIPRWLHSNWEEAREIIENRKI